MPRNKQAYYFYVISMTVSFLFLALGILPYIPNRALVMTIIISFITACTIFHIVAKRDPGIIRKRKDVSFLKMIDKSDKIGNFCPNCEVNTTPLSRHCMTC
jgi:hypothetical protein